MRRSSWIHLAGGIVGGVMLGAGLARLAHALTLNDVVWAVLGFLILGWALLDHRRYRRGTPESEIDGGHTLE